MSKMFEPVVCVDKILSPDVMLVYVYVLHIKDNKKGV